MDGRRALVIDDEVHFRYFLRVLLEKAGFAVKMARNGIEALDVLRSWRPDVITLDVMMPEQSGMTFYGAVCRDEDWKRIPVVMLSAVPISVREHAFATIGLTQGPLPPRGRLENRVRRKPCLRSSTGSFPNQPPPDPNARRSPMPKKILTIDDDPYIVKYIHEFISDNGYATWVPHPASRKPFPSSKRKGPISSRWTMEMPDEWGPRFYRKMSMNPAFKDTPVIVISGLQGIHLAIRNAVATLQKPFDPEELLSIVNRVLESKDAARKAMDGE